MQYSTPQCHYRYRDMATGTIGSCTGTPANYLHRIPDGRRVCLVQVHRPTRTGTCSCGSTGHCAHIALALRAEATLGAWLYDCAHDMQADNDTETRIRARASLTNIRTGRCEVLLSTP